MAYLIAIPFHELAHALVSDKLGDPTARNLGRLTMNPLKHLDPFGLLAMLLIGYGWAKPVPINPNYYKNRKVGMAVTAAAGPLSNLLLAYVAMVLFKLVYYIYLLINPAAVAAGVPAWLDGTMVVLSYFVLINIGLAVFNLIPIPPFDGSRILALFLPDRLYFAIQKYERYMMFALIAVLFLLPRLTPWDPLGVVLGQGRAAVYDAFDWATGFLDKLFLSLIRARLMG